MNKYLLLFFLSFIFSYSQIKKNNLSIQFENDNLESAIYKIEQVSNSKFYFDKKWLETETKIISASFNNITLENLLKEVFSSTKINYYVKDGAII